MKIKRFSITRYGPLWSGKEISLQNFNLFWGKNEEGKTLTIDALVKLLLGENVKDFSRIDRVEEPPNGYIILEDDNGKDIKLPEKGYLKEVIDLTASECRNIFIIRNSDLSIARENEFYTNVTDKLTGLRTNEISKIIESLREIGKLTPKGKIRSRGEEQLGKRVEKAKKLIKKIKKLCKKIKEKKFDELEEKAARYTQKKESLDYAIKGKRYEKGKASLGELKESLERVESLEIYNEKDKDLWRNCEGNIENWRKEKEELETELKNNKEKHTEKKEKLSKVKKEYKILDERKKKLDDEIKPNLKNYEENKKNVAEQKGKSKFFVLAGIISTILLGISLLGAIFNPALFFYMLATIFLISAGLSGGFKYRFVRNKTSLAGEFEKIKITLSKFELDAENIDGCRLNIQKFEDEHEKKSEDRDKIRQEMARLDEKINIQDENIQDKKESIKKAEEEIEKIKDKSNKKSLGGYKKMLKSKKNAKKSKDNKESFLGGLFGKKENESLDENILRWEGEIEELEKYKDKAGNEYSKKTISDLEREEKKVTNNLTSVRDDMNKIKKKMSESVEKANKILRLKEERLYCESSEDLKKIKRKLQGFIEETRTNAEIASNVIKIFKEIENEERKKVSELFGKESPVSKHFKEITGELYENVLFNSEERKIEVKEKEGKTLDPEKLSGGAYDQLYLSIRLALGEKLLEGKKGFFIMDDPFIKADPERLRRQIGILKKISSSGWQVMYFSAKGEIKDVLNEDIKKGDVNHVDIHRRFSLEGMGTSHNSE